ncbi:MAG: PilW family protein [Petrotogales bacterium]
MQRKKGLTMIELLIVLISSSIVIAIAFSLFSIGWKVYGNSQKKALLERNMRNVVEIISEELRWAKEATTTINPVGNNWITIFLEDGTIKWTKQSNGSLLKPQYLTDYQDVIVNNLSFNLSGSQDQKAVIHITLSASNASDERIGESITTSVVSYNLEENLLGESSSINYKK